MRQKGRNEKKVKLYEKQQHEFGIVLTYLIYVFVYRFIYLFPVFNFCLYSDKLQNIRR